MFSSILQDYTSTVIFIASVKYHTLLQCCPWDVNLKWRCGVIDLTPLVWSPPGVSSHALALTLWSVIEIIPLMLSYDQRYTVGTGTVENCAAASCENGEHLPTKPWKSTSYYCMCNINFVLINELLANPKRNKTKKLRINV